MTRPLSLASGEARRRPKYAAIAPTTRKAIRYTKIVCTFEPVKAVPPAPLTPGPPGLCGMEEPSAASAGNGQAHDERHRRGQQEPGALHVSPFSRIHMARMDHPDRRESKPCTGDPAMVGRPTFFVGFRTERRGPQRTGAGVAFSEIPADQAATANQPSAFSISPAATARAKARRILSRVRSAFRMSEISPGTPRDLSGSPHVVAAPGNRGPRMVREIRRDYLNRFCMMRIAPGPMMITNRAGRMHRISGKTILTGVCCAFASAV